MCAWVRIRLALCEFELILNVLMNQHKSPWWKKFGAYKDGTFFFIFWLISNKTTLNVLLAHLKVTLLSRILVMQCSKG